LDRNKAKKMVTLLTTEGVVTVKIYGDVFTYYDKQLSERGADGKKHVIEKSIFSRGTKIIVTGIRQEDSFIGKKYKSTPYHLVERIVDIDEDGTIQVQKERAQVE
jgi:DNA polymerase-3 subunit alpha